MPGSTENDTSSTIGLPLADVVDAQAGDLDAALGSGRHRSGSLLSWAPVARDRASVTRLTPTLSRASVSAGTSVAHGLSWIAERFSEIISPQSASGGRMPKPRNESEAMMITE